MLLHLAAPQVWRIVEDLRRQRYSTLRSMAGAAPMQDTGEEGEGLRSVVLPPVAWAVGRKLQEVRARGAEVAFTAIRRQGITGREPDGETELREGDVVVLYGTAEALEHAEAVLLAG
jgi:CPA2 family monovalent cation:H+ antiporter-2